MDFPTYILLNFCSITFICGSDYILCRLINTKARWFQLHFVCNCLITYCSFPETIDIFLNPEKSGEITENHLGGLIAFYLHIFHVLFFKLSTIDKYHHITSVFLCIPLSTLFKRKTLSMYYFFGTGLPGGIDYFLLTLVKNNRIPSIMEKYYNSKINTYIRIPGGVLGSYLTFYVAYHSKDHIQYITGMFLAIIAFLNATIFGKMAIENYIERRIK